MKLTEEQQAIIHADFEHNLITAVAGSGKTTTLAHRICYLLEQGHDPRRILVLMFNKAAKIDFEKKLRQVAADKFRSLPEIRTYHAMGLRLYHRFIQEGHLPSYIEPVLTEHEINFQLFNLLRQYAPESVQQNIKRNKKEFIELASTLLDMSKTTLLPIETTFEALDYNKEHLFLIDIIQRFEAWRKQQKRISFADMLYEPVHCLSQQPELAQLVTNKMDMILVDEYQDTNDIQHQLLRYIAGNRARVTVVGDPDQTIYEFRGAQPEFILNRFAEEFESPREYSLSYTFRYGHQVALLANHLITHNTGRKDVLCRSHPSTPSTKVFLRKTSDDTRAVTKDLERYHESNSLNEVAVLFRVWSQAVPIELALLSAQVPYHINQNKGALANREVNQVLTLMELTSKRLLSYPHAKREELFTNLLKFPHVGLKEEQLKQLATFLAQQESDWSDWLLSWIPDSLHALQKRKLRNTASAWQKVMMSGSNSARALRLYIKDTELFKSLTELSLTFDSAEERIQHVSAMEHYLSALNLPPLETLEHFDELKRRSSEKQPNKNQGVYLSTMHQTKGLEWPVVMIVGLNEQYLPYSMHQQGNNSTHLQAERRLLYVAMTRAKQSLYLYGPKASQDFGEKETMPSRFTREMAEDPSIKAGKFLDKLKSAKESNIEFEADTPLTPIARRYLDWHQVAYHQGKEVEEQTAGPVWEHTHVNHAILGPGQVTADLGDAFQVEFLDGKQMNFSKKSAHLYFVKQ